MSKSSVQVLAGAAVLSAASAAHAVFYTNEATFLSNISPTFYLEEFANHTFGAPLNGTQLTWDAPGGNGFNWQASAALGLYSVPGALSTNNAEDPLTITFSGTPVTAFGGNFTGTDINGNVIPAMVTVSLSNGEEQVLTNPTGSSFLGWTGTAAITSITVNSFDAAAFTWPTVDHFYVGTAGGGAPCPANIVTSGSSATNVDIDDLLAVISAWGPCPAPPASCPANIVTSGSSATNVDIDDLLAVISAWGPCP